MTGAAGSGDGHGVSFPVDAPRLAAALRRNARTLTAVGSAGGVLAAGALLLAATGFARPLTLTLLGVLLAALAANAALHLFLRRRIRGFASLTQPLVVVGEDALTFAGIPPIPWSDVAGLVYSDETASLARGGWFRRAVTSRTYRGGGSKITVTAIARSARYGRQARGTLRRYVIVAGESTALTMPVDTALDATACAHLRSALHAAAGRAGVPLLDTDDPRQAGGRVFDLINGRTPPEAEPLPRSELAGILAMDEPALVAWWWRVREHPVFVPRVEPGGAYPTARSGEDLTFVPVFTDAALAQAWVDQLSDAGGIRLNTGTFSAVASAAAAVGAGVVVNMLDDNAALSPRFVARYGKAETIPAGVPLSVGVPAAVPDGLLPRLRAWAEGEPDVARMALAHLVVPGGREELVVTVVTVPPSSPAHWGPRLQRAIPDGQELALVAAGTELGGEVLDCGVAVFVRGSAQPSD